MGNALIILRPILRLKGGFLKEGGEGEAKGDDKLF